MEIKNYTKCESCIHKYVCVYKNEQKEVLDETNAYITNLRYSGDFIFMFKCKDYYNNN